MDGGLCEQFVLRADKLHSSATLTLDQLALVETLAIGCHANDRSGATADDQVLIIGAGPIGLATLEFTRLSGAAISVMDMNTARLAFVESNYGISNTILNKGDGSEKEAMQRITGGDMFSVIIDATGNRQSMSGALQYIAPTGNLVYVGITVEEIAFKHPLMHRPEANLLASRNALPKDFRRIINLIESGTIKTDPWVTHRTSFEGVMHDFELFTRPETGVLTAMIELV